MDILSIDGLRVDGRRPAELRRVACEIGSISEVDGSALMSMGLTKVMHNLLVMLARVPASRTFSHWFSYRCLPQ